MSLVVERFLVCDKCGENFGVDTRSHTAEQHRQTAKSNGWAFYCGADYCPECVKAMGLKMRNKKP